MIDTESLHPRAELLRELQEVMNDHYLNSLQPAVEVDAEAQEVWELLKRLWEWETNTNG